MSSEFNYDIVSIESQKQETINIHDELFSGWFTPNRVIVCTSDLSFIEWLSKQYKPFMLRIPFDDQRYMQCLYVESHEMVQYGDMMQYFTIVFEDIYDRIDLLL